MIRRFLRRLTCATNGGHLFRGSTKVDGRGVLCSRCGTPKHPQR